MFSSPSRTKSEATTAFDQTVKNPLGPAKQTDRRLTPREAAHYLGVTLRTLKELRQRRRIPFYRLGHRTLRFSRKDLDAYLRRVRVSAIGEGVR